MSARVLVLRRGGAHDDGENFDLVVGAGAGLVCLESAAPGSGAPRLAVVTSETPADAWGVALTSDYLAVQRGCELPSLIDPKVMSGVIWRSGSRARRAIVEAPLDADALLRLGVADAILDGEDDPVEWARAWVGRRSVLALASAALLLRTRHGGTALERSEFTRLFSVGAPQRGLARFLAKQPLDFSETTEWEIR